MKLHTRNTIVLISLVLFQAFLAFNFLTISLENFSQKEGNSIIDNDMVTIMNHYAKFKTKLWEDVVRLDNRLPALIDVKSHITVEELLPLVMELTKSEDLDYVIVEQNSLRSGIHIKQPFLSMDYEKIPFDEGQWHPKVTLQAKEGSLYMIGSLRIDMQHGSSEPFIINIIREINDRFIKDLTYNTSAGIILFSENRAYAGTLDPTYYFSELLNLFNNPKEYSISKGFSKFIKNSTENRFYDIALYGKSYNISLSTFDTLPDHKHHITLALFSPNLSIKERITSIKSQFFMISILCVLLAVGLSLVISRSISLPVQRLGKAMTSLTQGQYPLVKQQNTAAEITQLYDDFNSMVSSIKYNASQQIAMIQEITFLKNYNEQIVESIQEGIAIIDMTGHLNLMNRAFYKFFPNLQTVEVPHIQLITLWDSVLEENLERIREGKQKSFSYTSRDDEGKLFDIRLYPLKNSEYDRSMEGSTIFMLEDITTKAKLESQLLQMEKINSLSILTAGVAHEINNPLASILANVENLHIIDNDIESQLSLSWIKKEINRIATIIKNLHIFTGNIGNEGTNQDDQDDWSSSIELYMKYALREFPGIKFTNLCSDNQPSLTIPNDQLLQILINLLNNAVEAIETCGNIVLKSEKKLIDGKHLLQIAISDDGPGIQQDILHKIFDPFYTTKSVGKGTGLGLSIVYGLINRYGGTITIETKVGIGSTFYLIIPLR